MGLVHFLVFDLCHVSLEGDFRLILANHFGRSLNCQGRVLSRLLVVDVAAKSQSLDFLVVCTGSLGPLSPICQEWSSVI